MAVAEELLTKYHSFHFIGIGGSGMSALAYVLLQRGYRVSGSDLKASHMAGLLARQGAKVYLGHAGEQVAGAEVVVVSTAIKPDNPELLAAQARGLLVVHRSDVLAALLNAAYGVAVAGAHGKSTTSAMIACIATEAQADPTVVVGGEVASLGGNARNGQGRLVVAEADESDGSFLKFYPQLAVVTNIEDDHLDHYGSEERIYQAFSQFVSQVKEGGRAILCTANPKAARLAREVKTPVISYGLAEADYTARNIVYGRAGTSYDLYYQDEFLDQVRLLVPGLHNVLNSLGAFAAARELGLGQEDVLASLARFPGVKRRFETKGRLRGVWVVDDYAHHPTEIAMTLQAARQTQPQRLLGVFQPHRYTRTQLLFQDFCRCFSALDQLVLCDVYSAGEEPIAGADSARLAAGIAAATGQEVHYLPRLDQAEAYLAGIIRPGDLVLTIGAGDVYKVGEGLVRGLERKG